MAQMVWTPPAPERFAEYLRFVLRAEVLIGGISVTVALLYVVLKLCWFFVQYLDRTLFANPW